MKGDGVFLFSFVLPLGTLQVMTFTFMNFLSCVTNTTLLYFVPLQCICFVFSKKTWEEGREGRRDGGKEKEKGGREGEKREGERKRMLSSMQ